jgi:hypothetical protein
VTVLPLLLALVPVAHGAPVAVLNESGGYVEGDGLRVSLEPDGRVQIWRLGMGQVYYGDSPSIVNSLSVGATTYSNSGVGSVWSTVVDEPVLGVTESAAVHGTLADGSSLVIWYDYTAPDEYIDVTVEYTPLASNDQLVTYAHFFDTYLSGGDNGPAYYDPEGAVGVTKAGLYEVFLQVDVPWSWYYSGQYYTPWNLVRNGGHLDGTLDYNEWTDNGIGVQWDLGVATDTVTFSYRIAFTTDVAVIVPPVSTSTGTSTATATATATPTATATSTGTPTATATSTFVDTGVLPPVDTGTSSVTATGTVTSTATSTFVDTGVLPVDTGVLPTSTFTGTSTFGDTGVLPTSTDTGTATSTWTATATSTATSTATATETATWIDTGVYPTDTATDTATDTHTCPECVCEPETNTVYVTSTVTSVETNTVYITETVVRTDVRTDVRTVTEYVTETVVRTDVRTDTVYVLVDEEDPELFKGGWSCSSAPGSAGLWVVIAAVLALVRRAAGR